jgi:Na+/H+-dicarboxylate symporter
VFAVITGLIVVNIINPGVGIDKKLVEDARKEGAREVKRAQSGHGPHGFRFDGGIRTYATTAVVSDTLELHDADESKVRIRVVHSPSADQAARVWLEHRADEEEEWARAGDPFTAETENAEHSFTATVPEGAKEIRLHFEPGSPGSTVVAAELEAGPPTIGDIFKNLVLMLFTDNLLGSMVGINLLPLIVFSIVFAGMLTTMGAKAQVISDLVIGINDALLNFILLLMKLAPIGIFCLVAARFGKAQADGQFLKLLQVQFYYMTTVLSGLGLHVVITLPLLLWIFTRRNPIKFVVQMSQAVLTAFSTASSTATLPVTMECAERKAGVSKRSTEFVLPLGATINMDGTALYEAAAAIFIAQSYAVINPDFQLTLMAQATIAVTATLAAIGAAGIPEAGLVTMLIVLNAVGLPIEMIGLILPVDWLLDRFRTAVNNFGDSVGAAIVDQTFPEAAA